MKNRKLKSYLKIGILLFGVSFLLENCENNNEENIHLSFENSENLNLKTVSFQDAKNFFNVKIEEVKEERKLYARKGGKTPLELTPNWNSIDHVELYGIEQAELTLADVTINRSGDYISKLFFINRNDKMESIIFTIFQEEIDNDGTIIEARMFFNELNGDFIDGYRIEDGKITKKIMVEKKPNVQKASMFMFFQEKEDHWYEDCLGGGGYVTNEIVIVSFGPYQSPDRSTGGISAATSGNNSNSSNYSGGGSGSGGRTSVTSVAGSLYTYAINERELAEGEEFENVPPSCKSFNFEKVNLNWQESSVANIRFNIVLIEIIAGVRVKKVIPIDFPEPVRFGMPTRFANGTEIPSGLAAEIGARAINHAIDDVISRYNNLVVSSTSTIRNHFKERLKLHFQDYSNGGRVNFNDMSITTNITQYKTYGIIPDSCY